MPVSEEVDDAFEKHRTALSPEVDPNRVVTVQKVLGAGRACILLSSNVECDLDATIHTLHTMSNFSIVAGEPIHVPDETVTLAALERCHILHVLECCYGNKKRAAEALGISRRALYRRLRALEIGHISCRARPIVTAAQPADAQDGQRCNTCGNPVVVEGDNLVCPTCTVNGLIGQS